MEKKNGPPRAKSRGFTLIEVIIAVSILGIIGYVMTGILARSFSAGDKSQALGSLKQNGQNIVNILESNIRDSQAIVCAESNILTLQKKDGIFLRYFLKLGTGSNPDVLLEDYPELADLEAPVNTKNLCDLNLAPEKNANGLNDTDLINGISVESLEFKINENPGGKDSVKILFDLKSLREPTLVESFQTTVVQR